MIDPRDVVLAELGAATALAGFVLVFLGIIIAAYQSYPGGVPQPVIEPYRRTGAALFSTFGLSLLTVVVCLLWLVLGGPTALYGWTVGLFFLQLVMAFLSAGWATRMVLWS